MRVRTRDLLGSAALLLVAGCGARTPEIHRFGGMTMGSTYEVKFVGEVPVATVQQAVDELLREFDLAFSKWRDDAEIVGLNRAAGAGRAALTPRFAAVLELALDIARRTDGAFDPTVAPLLALYRAARDDPEHHLDAAALDAARARVGHRHVEVRDGGLERATAGIELDLDGIVAGACIDAIAARLDALGVPGYYLEVTGEVFCRGEKAPGVPWQIGVTDPRADVLGGAEPIAILPLRDRALCTSGDYRNAFVADGRRVHHVFDPRTGRSADHGVVSVSVLAASAAVADALGTAFLVLGVDGTRDLLPRLAEFGPIGVLLLVADPDQKLRRVTFAWPQG